MLNIYLHSLKTHVFILWVIIAIHYLYVKPSKTGRVYAPSGFLYSTLAEQKAAKVSRVCSHWFCGLTFDTNLIFSSSTDRKSPLNCVEPAFFWPQA